MGSGIQGGGLTGGPAQASSVVAPSGQSAILVGPLGAGATDVVTKVGSSVADASVNTAAHLLSVRTGIGGTESEKLWVDKLGDIRSSAVATGRFRGSSASAGIIAVDDTQGVTLTYGVNGNIILDNTQTRFFSTAVGATFSVAVATGITAQYGTDSSGSPGAATIDKPSGKSAIAIAAASVVITCAVCTAASRVMITPQSRDATCKELIAVPGAGSFTVSGSAVATAAVVFSWEVSNLL